jgi:hypothetical protein
MIYHNLLNWRWDRREESSGKDFKKSGEEERGEGEERRSERWFSDGEMAEEVVREREAHVIPIIKHSAYERPNDKDARHPPTNESPAPDTEAMWGTRRAGTKTQSTAPGDVLLWIATAPWDPNVRKRTERDVDSTNCEACRIVEENEGGGEEEAVGKRGGREGGDA